jgi:biopolymer transport protein ExbB/TolQ
MKKNTNEIFFQLAALLMAVILVHTVYVTVVRPNADSIVRHAAEQAAAGGQYVVPRSFFVVIKDFEQEACFVLMFWALSIMGYKTRTSTRESAMLDMPLVSVAEGTRILPDDAGQLMRPLQSLPDQQKGLLLVRALRTALSRFQVTSSVQSATDAANAVCEAENNRLDSELSMIRYITWAIPSIGFIGTVRGIGSALGQAHEAIEGNIAGVTASLGVAFNSTFIALLISMFVMFFMHQLQLIQERLVLDSYDYCEDRLLRFLKSDSK